MAVSFVVFWIAVGFRIVSGWSYKGRNGPDVWHGQCTTGLSQSPIDIPITDNVRIDNFEPIVFESYEKFPKVETLSNVGHSIEMTIQPGKAKMHPKISGGGLPSKYQFAQLHFHWGSTDFHGSEHRIDGRSYPLEMHLVHFNLKYGSELIDALTNSKGEYDTIAVLAVLFKIQTDDNPNFDPLVKALHHIKPASSKRTYQNNLPLTNLLPRNTDIFYRYNGSLTTPPCVEFVIWTVFRDPVFVSSRQLEQFRQVVMVQHIHKHKEEQHQQQSDEQKHLKQEVDIVKQKNGQIGNRHKYEHVKDNSEKQVGHGDGQKDNSEGHNDDHKEGHHLKKMEDNFRSVQPLNGRHIFDVDTSVKHFDDDNLRNWRNYLDRTYGDEPMKSVDLFEEKDFGFLNHLVEPEAESEKDEKLLTHSSDSNNSIHLNNLTDSNHSVHLNHSVHSNHSTHSNHFVHSNHSIHLNHSTHLNTSTHSNHFTHREHESGIKSAKWLSLRNRSDQVKGFSWLLGFSGLVIYNSL